MKHKGISDQVTEMVNDLAKMYNQAPPMFLAGHKNGTLNLIFVVGSQYRQAAEYYPEYKGIPIKVAPDGSGFDNDRKELKNAVNDEHS